MTSTHSSGGGAEATRAEMTGPEIKAGRTFWKLYVALFLVIVAALAVVAGTMLSDSEDTTLPAGSAEPAQDVSPAAPEATTPEISATALAAEPEPAAEGPSQIRNDGEPGNLALAQNSAAESVKIGDIYQDADGVWRNRPPLTADTATSEFYQDENGVWHNRQPAPARTQAAGRNPDLGGLLGQMLTLTGQSESASSAPMDLFSILGSSSDLDLSGLLTSGALDVLGGGDLLNSGALEALGGLFNSAGGLDSLSGVLGTNTGLESSGDISGLFQMMEAVF